MEDARKRRERKERHQNRHEPLTNDTRIVHGTQTNIGYQAIGNLIVGVGPAMVDTFLQWQKSFFVFVFVSLAWVFASQCFGHSPLSCMVPSLGLLSVQNVPCPHCFGLYFLSGSQGMSRMLTFMLASSPKLTKMFCVCKCFFLMCSTLVLSFLLFGVGFELNLVSF